MPAIDQLRALSTEAPPAPAPLGALSPLPEVLLAHLCSFLSGRDLARLGGACAALHESPVSLRPRLWVGLRDGLLKPEEEDDEGWQRCHEALRTLARRAASGLKELRLGVDSISEAFLSAVRAGGRPVRLLTSLHVTCERWVGREFVTDEFRASFQQVSAEMLAAEQLPMLRELYLSTNEIKSVLPVWRAVGEGACPRLERIEVQYCSSQQLSELAEAMRARREGCEELRAVCLELSSSAGEEQAICEALQALLSQLSPRSLEELSLKYPPPESLQEAVIPAFSSSWAALKTLKLRFDVYDAPSADGLLHALARGAMPSLTSLSIERGTCSDEAWRALDEAMGPEGTCLRWLKTLKFFSFTGARQLEILCGAMGTGHGCPELEVIKISSERGHGGEPCGAALAPAFRPPHGLPRLKGLHLSSMNLTDLDQLVEALQHRPHTSQPMETIRLWSCKLEDAAVIGQALATGSSLACLRNLTIESSQKQVEWPMQLVEALAGGAGQQPEDIECKGDGMTIAAVNSLLQGLATREACPKLQSLLLGRAFGDRAIQGGQLDACSLGTILAGRAACSATLTELTLDGLNLSNEGARRLAACLREPQAIQLESLELYAVEPDACEAVMELLSALGGRAGDGLDSVFIRLSECERGEAMPVVEHLVGVIKAGGLSALEFCEINIQETWESVGGKAVQQALKERAQAQWLASW